MSTVFLDPLTRSAWLSPPTWAILQVRSCKRVSATVCEEPSHPLCLLPLNVRKAHSTRFIRHSKPKLPGVRGCGQITSLMATSVSASVATSKSFEQQRARLRSVTGVWPPRLCCLFRPLRRIMGLLSLWGRSGGVRGYRFHLRRHSCCF